MKRIAFSILLLLCTLIARSQSVTVNNNVPCGTITVQFIAWSADCSASVTSYVRTLSAMSTTFSMTDPTLWPTVPTSPPYVKYDVRVCYLDAPCFPKPFCNTVGDCSGPAVTFDIACCPSHPTVTLNWVSSPPYTFYTLNIN